MKDRKNLWSILIYLAIALIVFTICTTAWGLFEQTDPLQILKILADCCTIPGTLYLGIALIGWIGSKGTFDIFGYSVGSLFRLLRKEAYEQKQETFYDYRAKKDENRKPFDWLMLIVGASFIVLAIVLSIIYAAIA